MDSAARARDLFREAFGRPAASVGRAPGRVNLIGEHTDYNGGLCLPVALGQATHAAIAPRADLAVHLASAQAGRWHGEAADATGWAAYAAGVVWALREAGVDVPGLDVAIDSDVPVGAGLSSSAALEIAVATAVQGIVGPLAAEVVIAAGIRAERELAGAPTGGLDQTIAVHARAGHALLLDFADGSRTPVPWAPDGLSLLVIDTGVQHALADGQYAARRDECEEARRRLGVASLREVATPPHGDATWERRARHVVTENARVLTVVAAASTGDWSSVGEAFTASHASLRDDYEVSCAELDLAVHTALAAGATGARMTGGGFGGSAIALVPHDREPEVREAVAHAFAERGLASPSFLLAEPGGPAMLVET